MPRLPDFVLKPTIYLYPNEKAATDGTREGATGFLIAVPFQKETPGGLKSHIYVVTNRHVVTNNKSTFIRLNKEDGSIDIKAIDQIYWHHHPFGDDISVAYLASEIEWNAVLVLSDSILTQAMARRFNIGIGSDVFTIARFRDYKNPIARFGHIASKNTESVVNKEGIKQESILVELHTIEGHSGAPVYVSEGRVGESYIWLLGICWGYLWNEAQIYDDKGKSVESTQNESSKLQVRENTDIMTVVPAWKLQELLDDRDVKKDREERELVIIEEIEARTKTNP